MAEPVFAHRVTSMALLDYLDWVQSSQRLGSRKPLALPPLQRSALWRPRQVLNLWRSLFAGMPVGSFYLSRPGKDRRVLKTAGRSSTTTELGVEGFDLLDGQQRTHAMLLAVTTPLEAGKCVWVEALQDRIALHLTTRAQPFGFDAQDERLGVAARRAARVKFEAAHTTHKDELDHVLFDILIAECGKPPMPHYVQDSGKAWPLNELMTAWRAGIQREPAADRDSDHATSASSVPFGTYIHNAFSALDAAEIALILAEAPMGAADAEWLLSLFDRIGAGGTPLSGPERLFSMYKHHVPRVHDAVAAVSASGDGLLEPVEVARTAIRIAGTMKDKPLFWEPSPTEFQRQIAGVELRRHLDKLIQGRPTFEASPLGVAFASVSRLIRYTEPNGESPWDIGFPAVLVADLHPELLRVLVHWAVLSEGLDLDLVRADVVRFALFWHLCVSNDGKAAVKSAQVLHEWHKRGVRESFPWPALLRAITGVDNPVDDTEVSDDLPEAEDPSALRLVHPIRLAAVYGTYDPPFSSVLRDWKTRFERLGNSNTTELFHRWWWRSGMLLWLQRGYLHEVMPGYAPASGHEEDRPVDLDHLQPQAAYGGSQQKFLPQSTEIRAAFKNGRGTLGGSIGNLRWVPSAVNRSDGDDSIATKLRLESSKWISRSEQRPGARDGAMDAASRDLWMNASGPSDGTWTEDRIAAWQQAVEERTLWLYGRFWEEAGFDAWCPASAPS